MSTNVRVTLTCASKTPKGLFGHVNVRDFLGSIRAILSGHINARVD